MILRANGLEFQDLDEQQIMSVCSEEFDERYWTRMTTGTEAMRIQGKKFELFVKDDEPSLIDIEVEDETFEFKTVFHDKDNNDVVQIDKDGLSLQKMHVKGEIIGGGETEYKLYVDTDGALVKEVKNSNAGVIDMYKYYKNDDGYWYDQQFYDSNGSLITVAKYTYETDQQAREWIRYNTGIDVATGKIEDSIWDGACKITVDGDATALDLRNATVALRDNEDNLIAEIGTNAENRLAVSDADGTVAEVATDSIDQKVKLIIKKITKFEYYVQAATILIKAIKASVKGQEASDTGIDITYDDTKQNPDNESNIEITAGSITLTTLSNEFTLFGNTYKGFVDLNDRTTWTNEYLIDGSALASLESRISALENRLN